jgi:polyribonucleotide nucleotidyltransferase
MIGDLTATPEIGKTYLGKVVRLADFGAFVEIFPGTDGLLHISEVAEHRIKDVRDELKEGDQILVKVLSIEGNRIRLSRKAILREQRAKMQGQGAAAGSHEHPEPEIGESEHAIHAAPGAESQQASTVFEGGEEFDENEPNFNREQPAHAPAGGGHGGGYGGGRGGDRGRGPGGGGGRHRGRGGRGGRGGGNGRGGGRGPR